MLVCIHQPGNSRVHLLDDEYSYAENEATGREGY